MGDALDASLKQSQKNLDADFESMPTDLAKLPNDPAGFKAKGAYFDICDRQRKNQGWKEMQERQREEQAASNDAVPAVVTVAKTEARKRGRPRKDQAAK